MKEFRAKVASSVGLHARPAALFASTANKSGDTVRIAKILNGEATESVDGSSVLRVMTLGVKYGDEVIVTVTGESEESTSARLREIIESGVH